MSQQEPWQVAGNAAEVYDAYLVPAVFEPWAHMLTALAPLQPGGKVLDVACGTGVVARHAAQHVGASGHVTGLDLNPGMLAVASSHTTSSESAPITWQEGNAMALPFPDQAFDVVLCQLGLQFFPDRAVALQEMRRVLTPHGHLALLVWRSIQLSPGFAAFAEALERHISADAAAIMHAPFVFGDTTDALHQLITHAGFHDVVIRFEVRMVRFPSPEALVQSYAAGSPLAGHVAGADDMARTRLFGDVRTALQSYVDGEGLAFPIQGHLITART